VWEYVRHVTVPRAVPIPSPTGGAAPVCTLRWHTLEAGGVDPPCVPIFWRHGAPFTDNAESGPRKCDLYGPPLIDVRAVVQRPVESNGRSQPGEIPGDEAESATTIILQIRFGTIVEDIGTGHLPFGGSKIRVRR